MTSRGVGFGPDVIATAPSAKSSVPTDDGRLTVTERVPFRGLFGSVVEITLATGGTYIDILALEYILSSSHGMLTSKRTVPTGALEDGLWTAVNEPTIGTGRGFGRGAASVGTEA